MIAAAGCCCWLLLLIAAVDCCCWLQLLVAAAGCSPESLWKFPGYKWYISAKRIVQAKKSLSIFGCWWFAAKTILQAKKSLKIFGLLLKSLWIFPEFWWEESGREFHLGEVGSWRQQANEWKWLCAGYLYSIFSRWPPVEREPIGSFGEKWRAGRLGLLSRFFGKDRFWNCLRIISLRR